MTESDEGFVYPKIDRDQCIHCKLCEKHCPTLGSTQQNPPPNAAFAVTAGDDIRAVSSSGGAFTLLANTVLKQGGYVCGAAFEDNYRSVRHIIVNNEEGLQKLRRSKYIQSEMEDCFPKIKELLEAGKPVLFSGCPCQVAGLKAFLDHDYENLYTVDLICHGVPSKRAWRAFLDETYQAYEVEKAEDICFRDKAAGWRGKLLIKLVLQSGEVQELSYANNTGYYHAFVKSYNLRESCYICKYTNINRPADLTIGDFWGVHKYKRALNDNKGLSALLINNEKGQAMFERIRGDTVLAEKVPVEAVVAGNVMLSRSAGRPKGRDLFYLHLDDNSFSQSVKEAARTSRNPSTQAAAADAPHQNP